MIVLVRMGNTLDIAVTKADEAMRFMSGRNMGNEAQTMLMPACTVVHTSVLEYDGTRLFGLKARTTLTSPVTIVLCTILDNAVLVSFEDQNLQSTQSENTQHQPLLLAVHLHPHNDAHRHRKDDHIQEDLTRATPHPEHVIVKAVPRVRKAVDPAPLQRHAIGE